MAHSLDTIPIEILELILGKLCLHCQNTHPKTALRLNTDGRADKHTLTQVSLVNRSLQRVAQPILFHYFAIGQQIDEDRHKIVRRRVTHFARTIYERPDLGRAVRSLSLLPLAEDYYWKDSYPIEKETWARVPDTDHLMETTMIEKGPRGVGVPAKLHLRKITLVLLAACPNLVALGITVQAYEKHDGWKGLPPLSRLRILEVTAAPQTSFPIYETADIFGRMPALEALHTRDATFLCAHYYRDGSDADPPKDCEHRMWDVLPPTLRRIDVDCLNMSQLRRAFDQCVDLEDLAIEFSQRLNWMKGTETPPDGAFEVARNTLRRLAITVPSFAPTFDRAVFERLTAPGSDLQRAALTLVNLKELQILEIDQLALHAEVRRRLPDHPDTLSTVLPSKLARLCVTNVANWEAIRPQLLSLAAEKNEGSLKNLDVVGIRHYTWHDGRVPDWQEVVEVLKKAGIRCRVEAIQESGNEDYWNLFELNSLT